MIYQLDFSPIILNEQRRFRFNFQSLQIRGPPLYLNMSSLSLKMPRPFGRFSREIGELRSFSLFPSRSYDAMNNLKGKF